MFCGVSRTLANDLQLPRQRVTMKRKRTKDHWEDNHMARPDPDVFFREATKRICGSLDIETTLRETMNYLAEFMPLRGIIQFTIHRRSSAFTPVVSVSRQEDDRGYYEKAGLSLNSVRELLSAAHSTDTSEARKDLLVINHLQDHPDFAPYLERMFTHSPRFPLSMIVLYLELEHDAVGTLTFYSKGEDAYTQEHAELIRLLKEPFTVAMLNIRRYQDLIDSRIRLSEDNRYLNEHLSGQARREVVGANSGLKKVMDLVDQVASLDSPVLLLGETGVGKENIAHTIHDHSGRKKGPFIAVNCGAIPDSLIDNELFGHEKGAYTGATHRKRGRFERAEGGTLFLDEIGELPLAAQVRLLRVIQEMKIERIGGSEPVPINARVIAATHRDLKMMIDAGQFREDLWFRLNVFPITIPPLRERIDDISPLVHHFIEKKAKDLKLRTLPIILPETIFQLMEYSWPGNVRELENMVERALIKIRKRKGSYVLQFDFLIDPQHEKESHSISEEGHSRPATLGEREMAYIEYILTETQGKIYGPGGAAEILGLNPSTLRSRMKKLGVATHHH